MGPACVTGSRMCNAMAVPFVLHVYLVEEVVPDTWSESLIMAIQGRKRCSQNKKRGKNPLLQRWAMRSCAEQNTVMATAIRTGSPPQGPEHLESLDLLCISIPPLQVPSRVQGRTSARLTEHVSAAQERTNLGQPAFPQALLHGPQRLRSRAAGLVHVGSSFH